MKGESTCNRSKDPTCSFACPWSLASFCLPQDLDPVTNIAELMVPVKTFSKPSKDWVQKSKPELRDITPEVRRVFFLGQNIVEQAL